MFVKKRMLETTREGLSYVKTSFLIPKSNIVLRLLF